MTKVKGLVPDREGFRH